MKAINIGEIIKRQRLALGLTQEQLCEGICEPPTLSRIEKGHQTPTYSKLKALLGRLNLPSEKYYAMLSENELEIERLKNEIIDCNTRKLYADGLCKLDLLLPLVSEEDQLLQQFVLRSKVLLGRREEGRIIPYTLDEKIDLLFQAMRLTIPSFRIEDIGKHWYSLDEIKIINQIAIAYAENQQNEKAADVFQPLMNYLKRKYVFSSETSATAILIACNYSNLLCCQKCYGRAQEVAQWGYDKALEWGRAGSLGGLLCVLAECLYHHGMIEESKGYYMQSYYIFRALKNSSDMNIIHENIKEYYDIEL